MSELSPAFELVVESGFHSGARQRLSAGTYSVGCSADADISLHDAGLAPVQAHVVLDDDGCEVESVAGDVVLNGVAIAPGTARMVRYPADLVLDGVRLRWLRMRPAGWAGRRRSVVATAMVGSVAGLLATLMVFPGWPAAAVRTAADGNRAARSAASPECEPGCLVSGSNGPAATAPRMAVSELTASVGRPAKPTSRVNGSLASPPVSVPAAAAALQQQLQTAGLGGIEVTADATAVVAKGMVDPTALAVWRDIEQWFDRTFGLDVVLTSQVETKSSRPTAPLSVQAIWAGPGAYVIDGRGQKLFEGALINEGWVIERIEQGSVILRRGADKLAVRL